MREEAALLYLDAWTPHIRHDPDAVPVIEALRARGLKIGLLSNTHWPRAYHGANLERLTRVKAACDPENLFRFHQSLSPGDG